MAKALRTSKLTLAAETVTADYRLAYSSRRASVIGRAEVLRGNATFGIFGDGKEVAQLAMAKAFRPGDWRAGYYRDQTFMWATGMSNVRAFFAQLYGNTNLDADPSSGGRQMGNHFATRFLDERGEFKRSVELHNSTADVSNVAGWMPRLLGLAYASKLYRNNPQLRSSGRVLGQGQRSGFRDHRRCRHQRGPLLGDGERRGRPPGADRAVGLG